MKAKVVAEMEKELAARNFHSSGIPDYSELASLHLSSIMEHPKPTLTEEFKFETDKRAAFHGRATSNSMQPTTPMKHQQSQTESANSSAFKPKRMPDFSNFEDIKPIAKKPTVPIEPALSSTTRALERNLFDSTF